MTKRSLLVTVSGALIFALPLAAREPLANRIAHTDPSKFHHSPAVHDGAGSLDYMQLFGARDFNSNLFFLHRGIIEPKSGIGAHFHNQCEEMFIIFDGEAQFTIDGRTSLLKGPAGALCRMGHSHAIYNATDKPLQFMNINIGNQKDKYDAFNLGDSRVGAPLDEIPVFMTMHLDSSLLKPLNAGPNARGAVSYRRAFTPDVFNTNWSYVDHLALAPGAATGKERHAGVEEFYYVMNGEGLARINDESAPIHNGDAIPVLFNEVHSFENTGSSKLEFMIVGVARVKFAIDTEQVP
jgi:mannose-6-phosphate isomerase-like protein (cupin superfamily)